MQPKHRGDSRARWLVAGLLLALGCEARQQAPDAAHSDLPHPEESRVPGLPAAAPETSKPATPTAAPAGGIPARRTPPPLPLICPGDPVCRPGELRCGHSGQAGRADTLERCREDCSGFEVVRRCHAPVGGAAGAAGPSWPEFCGFDEALDDYACLPCACVPGESRCVGGDPHGGVERCADKCTGWKLTAGCGDNQCCRQVGRTATCGRQVCSAGAAWCEGDVLALCGADSCVPPVRQECEADDCDAEHGRCGRCDPQPEVCNGLDDDCDDAVDEDDPAEGAECDTGQPGICWLGEQRCVDGELVCVPQRVPLPDHRCDGVDHDCDGEVDEHWVSDGRMCGTGACARGRTCEDGRLSCRPGRPSEEVCNGIDDDCDRETDEAASGDWGECDTGRPGRCANGRLVCDDGQLTCVPKRPIVDDTCNGVDDDCDWEVDEHWDAGGRTCGVGLCEAAPWCEDGRERCEPGPPEAEVCNDLDDDCDGDVDEGIDEAGPECDTGRPGRCAVGQVLCVDGVLECVGPEPLVDDTCDGVDDDCDWEVDEHWDTGGRTCGRAACRAALWCEDGRERCEPGQPEAEVCNALDDDCDGDVDEDFLTVAPIPLDVTPPKLLILLDMSGSMVEPFERYDRARAAITEVLQDLRGAFLFGFDPFPETAAGRGCAVADPVLLDCAAGNEEAIGDWLWVHLPEGNTPLLSQFDVLLGDPGYAPGCLGGEQPGDAYVVVISDGGDTCGALDGAACGGTCAVELSERTRELFDEGVRTVAVGYGNGADEVAMNAIAAAGGTQFDRFLPAFDEEGLVDALSSIAGAIHGCRFEVDSPEVSQQPDDVNLYLDDDVVPRSDGCDGDVGWTWTDDQHTGLELCERTCDDAIAAQAELLLQVGCPTVVAP